MRGGVPAFFLLREPHTVHTAAYEGVSNPALALPPVGIGTLPARENRKCIRIFAVSVGNARR